MPVLKEARAEEDVMAKQSMPQLERRESRKYQCDDVDSLHQWLEGQGYQYYGQHNPGEYGRFSHQEAHHAADRDEYVHSYIQVMQDGSVYSPDPHAAELLDRLVRDAEA
jgi:hypothetical protein